MVCSNKDVGGKRTRIRGEYGSVEFNRNYDIAVADMFNRPRLAIDSNETTANVFNGSLKWLWEEYRSSTSSTGLGGALRIRPLLGTSSPL